MSEVQTKAEEREPYVCELAEPVQFEHDAEVNILTSLKLGRLINDFFTEVFADFVGCKIESGNRGLSLTLFFNHVADRDPDKHYAVELSAAKKTNNVTLDKLRAHDYRVKQGDRYSLTTDGEDIIKPLLLRVLTQNKKINWGSIVTEYTEPANIYGRGEQYTMVTGLDLNLICAVLFGKTDAEGNAISYEVDLKGATNIGGFVGSQTLVLWINRINNNKLTQTYVDLGLGTASNIIRA